MLLTREREAVLASWRRRVRALPVARGLDTPTLDDHIPQLFGEIALALHARTADNMTALLEDGSAPHHGHARLRSGYAIDEVVAEYSVLRACIFELFESRALVLDASTASVVNGVIDEAIAIAVKTYAVERARELDDRRRDHLVFIAHDLRTPLNAISIAAAALEQAARTPSPAFDASRMHATLRRNIANLQTLVDAAVREDVRVEFGGTPPIVRRRFDLWPLAEAVRLDLLPLAEKARVTVVNDVPDQLQVDADASLLRRVLQNLVVNAIRYTDDGTVRITAVGLDDDGTVECSVADDGEGIDPARIERIFERFETDRLDPASLGLGLPIVKANVEAHGGTVRVESMPGHGAAFRFTIPRAAGAPR